MKSWAVVCVWVAIFALAGCQRANVGVVTQPLTPPSPVTTLPRSPYQHPSQEGAARWVQYERALGGAILKTHNAICEWEVLGQNGREVYVWALCQSMRGKGESAASVPAVIYLGKEGHIVDVRVPRDGTQYEKDVRRMFPRKLSEKILRHMVDAEAMWQHLELRRQEGGPPLMVLEGKPLP